LFTDQVAKYFRNEKSPVPLNSVKMVNIGTGMKQLFAHTKLVMMLNVGEDVQSFKGTHLE
jgi:hypothetical protein